METANYKNYLLGVSISILIFYGCLAPLPSPSGENTLTAITVNDGSKDMVGNIVESNITFSDSAVAGTSQVTVKAISFSPKASANVNRNDTIPINKTITITAENGSTKNYAMSINVSTTTGNPAVGTITDVSIAMTNATAFGVMIEGSFMKLNNPSITELGILVTTGAMLNLELTSDNEAPNGAIKYTADAANLQIVNNPAVTNISSSFTVPNLNSFTTYYFRGYATIIGRGTLYTDKINVTTAVSRINATNFNIAYFNRSPGNLNALFRVNYSKDSSPILSFGLLITSGAGITLELNDNNAPPAGIRLVPGSTTAIATANASESGFLSLTASATNNSKTEDFTYSFRYYIRNAAGVTYTPIFRQTLISALTAIPDDNFRNAILSCINTNGETTLDGQTSTTHFGCTENFNGTITASGNLITTAAIFSISQFNYGNYLNNPDHPKIGSLSGVEQMLNLTRLNVNSNQIDTLDLSNNRALTFLNVGNNRLTRLDLSNNRALRELQAYDNQLSSSGLNLSNNTALTNLNVYNNRLSSLDLSNNTALTNLIIYNNILSSLDLSNNTALTNLNVYNNRLTRLDLSNNTVLNRLIVYNNSVACIRVDASQLEDGANEIAAVIKGGWQFVSESCP